LNYIYDQKIEKNVTVENLILSCLLSIELKFEEFKREIINHVNEIINDDNVFEFTKYSLLYKDTLGDLLLIILKKFFSKKDFWSIDLDDENFKFLFKMSQFKYNEIRLPIRLNFDRKLKEIVMECFNDPDVSDFQIKSNTKIFFVNKNVLNNYSFFQAMENEKDHEIKKPSEIVETFLKLLYNNYYINFFSFEIPKNHNDIIHLFDLLFEYKLEKDSIEILKKLEKFILPENLDSLFSLFIHYEKLKLNQEIHDLWNQFYQKMIDLVTSEKNIDLILPLVIKFKDNKYFDNINNLVFEYSKKENYLKIFYFYFDNDVIGLLNKKFEDVVDENEKMVLKILNSHMNLKNEFKEFKEFTFKEFEKLNSKGLNNLP
jgi:hypothetical protein